MSSVRSADREASLSSESGSTRLTRRRRSSSLMLLTLLNSLIVVAFLCTRPHPAPVERRPDSALADHARAPSEGAALPDGGALETQLSSGRARLPPVRASG